MADTLTDEELRRLAEEWNGGSGGKSGAAYRITLMLPLLRRVATEAARAPHVRPPVREILLDWLGSTVVGCGHYQGVVQPKAGLVERTAAALASGEESRSGPCSACGDGDTDQKFHRHEESREPASADELRRIARAKDWHCGCGRKRSVHSGLNCGPVQDRRSEPASAGPAEEPGR